jgi:hypothetical protein
VSERATICNEADVELQESVATITNCLVEGCLLDSSSAVVMSHSAPGVKVISRLACCDALAGAATDSPRTAATALAASTITIAVETQR